MAEQTDEIPVMGAYEAAHALGVRVPNLRKQVGLPQPIAQLRSGPIWWTTDIHRFAQERGQKEA